MIETLVVIVATAALTGLYLTVTRRRRLPRLQGDLSNVPHVASSIGQLAGLTGGTVVEGNEATVFQDGHMINELLRGIEQARSTIHFETYVWSRGEAEDAFSSLLCRKAEEGVTVRVLLDAMGALSASKSQLDRLRQSGVAVDNYHPISQLSLRRYNNRTHRKLLIIDGEVGYTFGHGVQDEWLGEAQDKKHWRDTGVRLRGPIVCALQVIFAQDWIETTGAPPLEAGCFVQGPAQGSVQGHVVASSTRGGHSSVALLYMLAIAGARREIIIQNAYFAPSKAVLDLLKRATARGVSVKLMLPGRYTDSPLVRRAGQHLYNQLLRAGIEIYLYDNTFLHQKIVVVDRVWSHIGSTNFDARSLLLNTELGVGLLDKRVAEQLIQAFDDDSRHCRYLELDEWQKRPVRQRALDKAAYWCQGQI